MREEVAAALDLAKDGEKQTVAIDRLFQKELPHKY